MTTPPPDLATLAASGAHPGWLVLDAARLHQFTGELLITAPITARLYFDTGATYHAERACDPSLCERLLAADVITPVQIDRGVVRVGNIENLGRLFDRDVSVDRDAVMVVIESAADEIVSEVANHDSVGFSSTAYRHHVSGLHRWFVAPDDPRQLTPVSEVAQIDGSITSDLPTLSELPSTRDADVQIEWHSALDRRTTADASTRTRSSDNEAPPQSMLEDAVAAVDVDEASLVDWSQQLTRPGVDDSLRQEPDIVILSSESETHVARHDEPDDEFQIHWPDGTEQNLSDRSPVSPDPVEASPEPSPITDEVVADSVPATTETVAGEPASMAEAVDAPDTPASLDDSPFVAPAADVNDSMLATSTPPRENNHTPAGAPHRQITDASRRALDAIGSFSVERPQPPEPESADLPEGAAVAADESVAHAAIDTADAQSGRPIEAPRDAIETPPAGFAPPAMETSAEVVYARRAEAEAEPQALEAQTSTSGGEPNVGSADRDDRVRALRRLIANIRRK